MFELAIVDLNVKLGENRIACGLSLEVEPGEVVSILGPSGCGKSTLLKVLTGEVPAQSGNVLFRGQQLIQSDVVFALMPQRDALMPWRSILDNAILGLEVNGVTRRAARSRVLPIIQEFGLEGFEHHYPDQISGGMRQRAALLRTIAVESPIILLDEPFGALDALTRIRMQQWFERRWMKQSWTAVLITHDVREAVTLSDRVYVLSRRPTKVTREIKIALPRPRTDNPVSAQAREYETEILDILLN
ncbi:ABC transporter [Tateyamaria omphalii]|uniref:ABC transporter ATP-binding protein n=1 Tax=Tateyamaria omphalii TaxID=299262 RepID=UPI00167286FE|nr:ABC transporter ATP-binding protein [Tateyamaria omphalii]GGX70970.1 ABC transporter [Tateyamaria omphalii]